MTPTRALRAMLVCVALLACGDTGGPGMPGTLDVSVTTPHGDDGGILLRISGPSVNQVTAIDASHVVYWRLVGANEIRVLLIGDFASGPLLRLGVPDARRASEYTGTALDVTDRNNAVRNDLDAYEVSFGRERE